MRAIQFAVMENSHLIPPYGEGMKLYVRPMMLGSGQQLGLYPSKEFSLLFYVSPTGNYFKSATGELSIVCFLYFIFNFPHAVLFS